MKHSSSNRPSWITLLLISLGAILLLALLFSVQAIIFGAGDLRTAVRAAAPFWLPWLVAAPLVVWISFRFPFRSRTWPSSLLLHIVVCAVVVFSNQRISNHLIPPLRSAPQKIDGPPEWVVEAWNANRQGDMQPPPHIAHHRPRGLPRFAFDALVYVLLMSVSASAGWARQVRERERRSLLTEAQLAESRLSALRMQLNPHFLFNSLNSISSLIHSNPAAADNMLGDLSELLRITLDSSSESEIPLKQELHYIHQYLGIEKIRFGKRLEIKEHIDPATLDVLVPSMILQPLVENCIKHALGSRTEPITIQLDALLSESRLSIRITDNGPGLLPSQERKIGIGLNNTMERLEHLYGNEGHFGLRNADHGGCESVVEIPLRRSGQGA